MTSIFNDKVLEKKFQDKGFNVIGSVSANILSECEILLESNFASFNQSMFVSHYENNLEVNLKISNSLKEIFSEWFENTFDEYEFVLGHFIVKANKDSQEFRLHQDWSVVDEKKYPFVHIWVPLQDTNVENGGLFFLPKSHNFFNNFRSGSLGIPFVDIDKKLEKYIRYVEMKRGEAFLYHPALFHGSSPNKSSRSRKAVLLTVRPKVANLEYYHLNKDDKVDVFSIDSNELLGNLKSLTISEKPSSYSTVRNTNKVNSVNNSDINNELILKCVNSL